MGTLYREPMGRLVLRHKKSKNLSGEAYIQSSNTNALVSHLTFQFFAGFSYSW